MSPPRIAVVGAGIAGASLAWRLARHPARVRVELFGGAPDPSDATAASGGLVRAFDPDPDVCRTAAESLAEFLGCATLRGWAGLREIGSVHLLPPGADPDGPARIVEALVPGSVEILDRGELTRRYPFRGLPAGTLGVAERRAGVLSPARLRGRLLDDAVRVGAVLHTSRVASVDTRPAVRLADGTSLGVDVVVLATGAHTARLLASSALPHVCLRTRRIQYTVHRVRLPGLGSFVDDTSGLYGRPDGPGGFLLGLPSDRWDVDPDTVREDAELAGAVVAAARNRLGVEVGGGRTVTAAECFTERPGLALRPTVPGAPVLTFTGGSGAAAKSVLATGRAAAAELAALTACRPG